MSPVNDIFIYIDITNCPGEQSAESVTFLVNGCDVSSDKRAILGNPIT
jgi:hypothetical protein